MGILSKAWNFTKKVVTAPQFLVAKTVEGVGTLLYQSNTAVVWRSGLGLQNLGENLTPKCYIQSEKTVQSTVDVGKDCQTYFQMARSILEPKIDELCKKEYEKIIACREKLQLLVPGNVFQQIKSCIPSEPFSKIRQACWDEIAAKVSTDNKDLLSLLEIPDDSERSEKCREYITSVTEKIAEETWDAIAHETKDIVRQMVEVIKDYMSSQERILEERRQDLAELERQRNNSEFVQQRLSSKIVDVAYLSCVISATEI